MKKQMLIALGLFFALTVQKVSAQNETSSKEFKDTLILVPTPNIKILFIGNNLDDMAAYKRLDTIKAQLIADVEEAQKNPSYPAAPKTTYYIVSKNGKRRLKTESEDYLEPEINIKKEKASLDLSLPPYLFAINDFSNVNYFTRMYECLIYVDKPERLMELRDINFNDALAVAAKNKKMNRKYYQVKLEKIGSEWKCTDSVRFKSKTAIEFSPVVGFSVTGGRLSPLIGVNTSTLFYNKYHIPTFAPILEFTVNNFTQLRNEKIISSDFVQSYTLKLPFNFISSNPTSNDKPFFLGVEAGWLTSKTAAWLNSSLKLGLLSMNQKGTFSFDVIFKGSNRIYSATYAFPFL